ncbi:GntR family transcriptional regulator [Burkholderia pyrrocinia]|uniref:GntR family transcriptional regulator n=1 Tax=Burkholderia pyrrocinia TaxID=60550 RepID=UPI0015750D78|nr:GntR family transcriptional regulator [Burkholderia pyrrocinia]NTX25691.1 GntR family transcriptional regulator [Burkholderia pyrrocinia]
MPTPRVQAAPSRRLTAYQYAVQTLRADILQGRMTAGERLRQDDLAKRLEMSTTPVREALRTLISEGLVFFDAHRGAVVRGLTLGDVQEIYRLRKVLEPMMVDEAMRGITSDDIARAETFHEEMLQTQDVTRWTELNLEFHAALWASQANSRLAHLVKTLRDAAAPYIALSLYMSPEHIARSNTEHDDILTQYKQRDAEAAKHQTILHLDDTLEIIVRAIDNSGDVDSGGA